MTKPAVYAHNFWGDFDFRDSFIGYLLSIAFGEYSVAPSEDEADVIFVSVFGRNPTKYKNRAIAIVWENLRPNLFEAQYAMSSDFDDYGGRHIRCPYWYTQIAWPDFRPGNIKPDARNYGFEPTIPIDTLLAPRPYSNTGARSKFCSFVAGIRELHRLYAVQALSSIGELDLFGNIVGRPLRASKLEVLKDYRFNLCFENSMFPGYHTEKILHASAAGCVPLYFADLFANRDFNPAAFINRAAFSTLAEFVAFVARIQASNDAVTEIAAQPLLLKAPSLDPIIAFMRRVFTEIGREHGTQFV